MEFTLDLTLQNMISCLSLTGCCCLYSLLICVSSTACLVLSQLCASGSSSTGSMMVSHPFYLPLKLCAFSVLLSSPRTRVRRGWSLIATLESKEKMVYNW